MTPVALLVRIPDGLPSERAIAEHMARGGLWIVRGEGGTFADRGPWVRCAIVLPRSHGAAHWPAVEWYLRGGVDNGGGRALGALAVVVAT